MKRPTPTGTRYEGMNDKALPSDLWHAPNGMQLSESSETPKNEMKKEC